MVTDPRQIVTPFAFKVHKDLLGLPLATPKRRFLALLIDLIIASILTNLGAYLLAFAATGIFFWVAIRTSSGSWWKNLLRYSGAVFASLFVFAASFYFTKSENDFTNDESSVTTNFTLDSTKVTTTQTVDWGAFAKQMMEVDYSNEEDIERFAEELETQYGMQSKEAEDDTDIYSRLFEASFLPLLNEFSSAVTYRDSAQIDSLRSELVPLIASVEIEAQKKEIDRLDDLNDDLEDKNEDMKETIENPSFLRSLKAFAEDVGLGIGWIGIYFILCLALFRGQTLGKKILGLRVVRLNNKPIGLWYSFERFGGYAAGVATGLLGFFQVYWDANRQGIHDKIASTVVIDTREKKRKKFQQLREEILGSDSD